MDAREIGERVLAGLAKARARRWPEHAARVRAIREALDLDILADKPKRGRAARIARKLHLPPSTVKRILAALFCVGDSP